MRIEARLARVTCAALLALILALRLLTPAGFMPAFDRGAVAIVLCPDADLSPAMAAHHQGHSKNLHQPCSYASAAGHDAVALDFAELIGASIAALALLLGRNSTVIEPRRAYERPPPRGPPLLA